MTLHIQPITKDHALDILLWRYASPYDFYNFEGDPESGLAEFLYCENAFHAILNEQDSLEGYCSFGADGQVPGGDYRPKALDLGLGIRPELTGKGHGKYYARAVMAYGLESSKAQRLRVTIAAFNKRAQRVWSKLGFKPEEAFTKLSTEERFLILYSEANIQSLV